MLKILQARLQQYMNHEVPDVQDRFRKGRGTRDQTANIHWIIEKAREFQENIYFCFMNYTLACVDHKKLWKILQEMGIPDHLTCLLRNLHAAQEATVRTGHGTMDGSFPCGSAGKESACNAGDPGPIPGLGRYPGEGNSYLLQYSGLENSMDCMVHGVAKSRTRLSNFHFHFSLFQIGKGV